MRVADEHDCNLLNHQNQSENDIMAVQFMVEDKTETEAAPLGWYLVNYRRKGPDIAFGIRCCPYCGKVLKR